MKLHAVKQGSPEWLALRLGIPTASEFDALISPEWKVRTGAMPNTYLYRKVAERALGFSLNDASSFAMEQGSILENEARPFFEFTYDMPVQTVGFATTDDGRVGCSPDGLIGEDGGLEIKCPSPQVHLRYLMEGKLPAEYAAQVHGSMFVTGRRWWKFLSYSRQFPALVVHVERDEAIQSALRAALDGFLVKFDAKLAQIRAMKDAENAHKTAAYLATNPGNL